jgi:hypothetical protein
MAMINKINILMADLVAYETDDGVLEAVTGEVRLLIILSPDRARYPDDHVYHKHDDSMMILNGCWIIVMVV